MAGRHDHPDATINQSGDGFEQHSDFVAMETAKDHTASAGLNPSCDLTETSWRDRRSIAAYFRFPATRHRSGGAPRSINLCRSTSACARIALIRRKVREINERTIL